MNIKHAIAAAVMAVAASSSFAADSLTLAPAVQLNSGSGAFSYNFNSTGYSDAIVNISAVALFGTLGINTVTLDGTTLTGSFNTANTLGAWTYNGALTEGSHAVGVSYSGVAGNLYTVSATLSGTPITQSNVGTLAGTGTVTAVPEPETYAMMLAGLGALGFIGRRRKAK